MAKVFFSVPARVGSPAFARGPAAIGRAPASAKAMAHKRKPAPTDAGGRSPAARPPMGLAGSDYLLDFHLLGCVRAGRPTRNVRQAVDVPPLLDVSAVFHPRLERVQLLEVEHDHVHQLRV